MALVLNLSQVETYAVRNIAAARARMANNVVIYRHGRARVIEHYRQPRRSKETKNAFVARRRQHGDLEESVIDTIAAVASITGVKQNLIHAETNRNCALKHVPRKMLRQAPEKRIFGNVLERWF